jgi:3-hydroxyacyl-[acyl-carrier-protein] dehydratase
MLQIVKEALENVLKCSLRLRKADQLKFMSIIDPTQIQAVQLEISYKEMEDGDISSTAKLYNQEIIYFKFQGSFVKA